MGPGIRSSTLVGGRDLSSSAAVVVAGWWNVFGAVASTLKRCLRCGCAFFVVLVAGALNGAGVAGG